MRRLLFTAGVKVMIANGDLPEESVKTLEELLGPGRVPTELKPDLILQTLDDRQEAVRTRVPSLRRAQIIRDLRTIAKANGEVSQAECSAIHEVARAIGVSESYVSCWDG